MNNSLVTQLSEYVEALFLDIAYTYSRPKEMERDKTRLISELAHHGMRTLTIDLPALCKHFDRCLDEGQYTPSGLYLSGMPSKRVQVPAFLRELYLKVFDSHGVLRDVPCIDSIGAIRMIYKAMAKPKLPCKKEATFEEVNNFYRIEQELRLPTLCWQGDTLTIDHDCRSVHFSDLASSTSRSRSSEREPVLSLDLWETPRISREDAAILQQVCDRISSQFGDFHNESEHELPQHGRGRVSNHPKNMSKYIFDEWPDKLDAIFSYDLYATTDLSASTSIDDSSTVRFRKESPSKLIAVPKTMSGPRLIASEPNQHQFLQQLIRNQIEARIGKTDLHKCVSFGNQAPNRILAIFGSVYGSFATVDLKSASDRLTCWTVERALRANLSWLERLHATRTRVLRNGISNKPFNQLKLKKMFSQGSACTFPVQTVIYSMIAIASVILSESRRVTSQTISEAASRVRVFGDDIIVPTHSLEKLKELLVFNQLAVNINKTFSKGKFRESCGIDVYDGVNVTPTYIKIRSLSPTGDQVSSVLDSCNNLHKTGYWNLAKWLASTLKRYKIPVVGPRSSFPGLYSFLDPSRSFSGYKLGPGIKTRYNAKLHRFEASVHWLNTKAEVLQTDGRHNLYQYFIDRPNSSWFKPSNWKAGIMAQNSSVMRRGWYPLELIQGY